MPKLAQSLRAHQCRRCKAPTPESVRVHPWLARGNSSPMHGVGGSRQRRRYNLSPSRANQCMISMRRLYSPLVSRVATTFTSCRATFPSRRVVISAKQVSTLFFYLCFFSYRHWKAMVLPHIRLSHWLLSAMSRLSLTHWCHCRRSV